MNIGRVVKGAKSNEVQGEEKMIFGCERAQSLGEYVILVALIAAVFFGMQTYVKRGMQGRLRDASDFLVTSMKEEAGLPVNALSTNQFEPAYATHARNTEDRGHWVESMSLGGASRKDFTNNSELNRTSVNSTEEVITRYDEEE